MGVGDFVDKVLHPGSTIKNFGSSISSAWDDYTGVAGQKAANKTNIALQRQQQDWEQMMAGTAVQRRAADLSAAGVNPLLAAGQAADVPNVAPARVESTGKGIASAVTSLVATLASSVNSLSSAQAAQANAVYTAGPHTAQTVADTRLTDAKQEQVKQETRNLKEEFNVILHTSSLKDAEVAGQRLANRISAMELEQRWALFPSFLEIQANAAEVSKGRTAKDMEMINSWIGTVGAAFRQGLGSVSPLINSAGSLIK